MSEQDTWSAVDAYLTDRLVGSHSDLQFALAASRAAGLPDIQVSPTQGKFLMLMAQAVRARSILEIGTLAGYSSIWLARALPADGLLVTCEVNAKHAAVARSNLAHAGLGPVAQVRLGPAIDTLSELIRARHPPFDLVFIDADKPSNAAYFTAALKLSRIGTVIITDNVVRAGEILDEDSSDAAVRGVRSFIERVAGDSGVSATALQTVGEKGYDGFALALVTRLEPAG
jgi:predicted O-methyltransferase YrrM